MSVIIPTHGRPELLERAIRSVVCQSYVHWELLVVDDNGEGTPAARETERLLERFGYDGRIRYVAHESNLGGSQARNTGISLATGDFVAFLDDDDEWSPSKLEVQCRTFESLSAEVAAVYCGYCVGSSGSSTATVVPGRSFRRPYPQILVENFVGTTSTLMCRRSTMSVIGGFDAELPAAQDREFLIRLCRSYRIACIEEPLVRFNWHSGDRISKHPDRKLEAQKQLYKRYSDDLRRSPRLHSRFLVDKGKLQLQCSQSKRAARSFFRAWLANPANMAALTYALLCSVDGSLYEWLRRTTWKVRHGNAHEAGRYR